MVAGRHPRHEGALKLLKVAQGRDAEKHLCARRHRQPAAWGVTETSRSNRMCPMNSHHGRGERREELNSATQGWGGRGGCFIFTKNDSKWVHSKLGKFPLHQYLCFQILQPLIKPTAIGIEGVKFKMLWSLIYTWRKPFFWKFVKKACKILQFIKTLNYLLS